MTADNVTHALRYLRKLAGADADLGDGELLDRFLRGREETAFALLVQRHGAMVLGVCRRLLSDAHDAEDAFQATFLVLARKAADIRTTGSLASWLHGVARKVAGRARLRDARRLAREREALTMPRPEPCDELSWRELRDVLDEELASLPEKYRTPLVLCYLEGKTHGQAAAEIGCPRTSLSSRLAKARALLHERLTRRGLALSAAALAVALTEDAAASSVPALLTLATVRAAVRGAQAGVEALAEGVTTGLSVAKGKGVPALLLAAGLLAAVGFGASSSQPPTPAPAVPSLPRAAEPGEPRARDEQGKTLAGTVVDAAGRPVGAASVWVTSYQYWAKRVDVVDHVVTDEKGRFRLAAPRERFLTPRGDQTEMAVLAHKPGSRVAAISLRTDSGPPSADVPLVLKPAAGAAVQVVTPDGKPAAGARAEVVAVVCDLVLVGEDETKARQWTDKPRATPLGFVVNRSWAMLPDELRRSFVGRTDAGGIVAFRDVDRADLGRLALAAEGFGEQIVSHEAFTPEGAAPPPFPARVALLPVGRLTGRLVSKAPADARGFTLHITTSEERQENYLRRSGDADVTPGADGTFEVRALAAGAADVQALPPTGSAARARLPADRSVQVKPGAKTDVEIPVETAVRVSGVVRERGTNRPLAGVRVRILSDNGRVAETAVTDTEGRYSSLALPGPTYHGALPPPSFLPPPRDDAASVMQVPADKSTYEASPIELTRSATLRGRVVDDDDRPVAGATVRAVWVGADRLPSGREGPARPFEKELTADERGEFRMEGRRTTDEVFLQGRHEGAVTTEVTTARAGGEKPVVLRLIHKPGKTVRFARS